MPGFIILWELPLLHLLGLGFNMQINMPITNCHAYARDIFTSPALSSSWSSRPEVESVSDKIELREEARESLPSFFLPLGADRRSTEDLPEFER